MKNLIFILKYIRYYLLAQTKHDVHSPFVFNLFTNVISNKQPFYIFEHIEAIRNELLQSSTLINITDYGAGSSINSSNKRKVKDIVKNSAKSPKYGQLLFRLIYHFQPQHLIELGTSLGISTIYQAAPNSLAKIITIEGCPETAKIAQQNFNKLHIANIEMITGRFDEQLPNALNQLGRVDYVFFDGNHQKIPTLRYFEACLPYINNNTFFILDDIHWSSGMEEAWNEIKNHPKVTVTIDLFFLGFVFFRKEQAKQHFTIRF